MLKELFIKNFLFLDELLLSFHQGFTSITGESGSGKSLLIEAIRLLMGEKITDKKILSKDHVCVIQAKVYAEKKQLFAALFAEFSLDLSSVLIIRREITPSGKSRVFINDQQASILFLKKLSSFLFLLD